MQLNAKQMECFASKISLKSEQWLDCRTENNLSPQISDVSCTWFSVEGKLSKLTWYFSSEIFLLDKKFSVSQKLDLSFVETQTTSLWNLKMSQIVLRFAICNQKSEFSVVSRGKQWDWSLLNKDIVMVHNLSYVSIFLKCVKTHKQLF